ncbi:MAG: extracellular matrix regulatory protein, partial [Petrotoga sp.]|nr:extracellular matrix regulatory protein [Petrotoga sp.]
TRAFIITDSGHVIASAIQPETITNRFLQNYYDIEKVLDKIRKEVL